MPELVAPARAWWAHRQVWRATIAIVAAAAVLVLVGCLYRVHQDGTEASPAELVHGHRYLVAPGVIVTLVGAGLAGSTTTWDRAAGWSSTVVAWGPRRSIGWLTLVLATSLAAAAWAVAVTASVAVGAAGALAAFGRGSGASVLPWLDALPLLARVGAGAFGLGTMATVLGCLLPGRALPALAAPLGLLLAELAQTGVAWSRTNLLGGGSLMLLFDGRSGARDLGMAPGAAALAGAVAWAVVPVVSLALLLAVERRRGLR